MIFEIVIFFFFQAEDGIRDRTVTGVQTCALPIYNETMRAWGSRYARLVLDRSAGNKREACRVLGISYHTLQAYLRYPVYEPRGDREEVWPADAGDDAPAEEASIADA